MKHLHLANAGGHIRKKYEIYARSNATKCRASRNEPVLPRSVLRTECSGMLDLTLVIQHLSSTSRLLGCGSTPCVFHVGRGSPAPVLSPDLTFGKSSRWRPCRKLRVPPTDWRGGVCFSPCEKSLRAVQELER